MKAIIQRVKSASVTIENKTVARIGHGLCVLLGVAEGDTPQKAEQLARKVALLRVFCDENDKMNKNVLEVGGGALVVSNFTVCADTSHGHRPSFTPAAAPEVAQPLYELFVKELAGNGIDEIGTGHFGADMLVELQNDGPVTVTLEL